MTYEWKREKNAEPYRKPESLSSKIPLLDNNVLLPVPSSSSLRTTGRLRLVVESPMSCRRAKVTKEGCIQVPSNIKPPKLIRAVSNLSLSAGERRDAEEEEEKRCQEAIQEVQWKFGLQKVSRSNNRVCRKDYFSALYRLINTKSQVVEEYLSGSSIEIGTSSQLCHLSDDGGFIIPHDWRWTKL